MEAASLFDIPWRLEPRFAALNHTASSSNTSSNAKSSGKDSEAQQSIKELLQSAFTMPEATQIAVGAITHKLSDMFMIPVAEIDPSLPTSTYGVDSLVAVELRNWLFAKAGAEMSIFDMLQSKSLVVLAEKVVARSRFVTGDGGGEVGGGLSVDANVRAGSGTGILEGKKG